MELRRFLCQDPIPTSTLNPIRHPFAAHALRTAAKGEGRSVGDPKLLDQPWERGGYLKRAGLSGLAKILDSQFGHAASKTPEGKVAMAEYVLRQMSTYSVTDGAHRYLVDGKVDWKPGAVADRLAEGEVVTLAFQNLKAHTMVSILNLQQRPIPGGSERTYTTREQNVGRWDTNAALSGTFSTLDGFLTWLPKSHSPVL